MLTPARLQVVVTMPYDYCGHTVVDQARQGEAFIITRHGKREAVILSFEEWERLSRVPSFGQLLMQAPLEPGDVAARYDGLRELEF